MLVFNSPTTVKALLSSRGVLFNSGPTRGGLNREGGGGAYLKSYIFDEIHNNFPNFTFTPIANTEQEIGFCITT